VKVGNKTNTQNTPLQRRIGKLNSEAGKLQVYNPTSSIYYENGEYKQKPHYQFPSETP